jgi:hypothetical protein
MRSMAIIACKLQKFSALEHPLKLKKHAECFFKQNLKTNSAAVKRYQESLSPNGKAQIMVKNGAEQQKHQQSLSPVDKVQMICKNADAHRKQRESFPSEKKVNVLETNADAHKEKQESLSPENKNLFVTNIANLSLLIRKLK